MQLKSLSHPILFTPVKLRDLVLLDNAWALLLTRPGIAEPSGSGQPQIAALLVGDCSTDPIGGLLLLGWLRLLLVLLTHRTSICSLCIRAPASEPALASPYYSILVSPTSQ